VNTPVMNQGNMNKTYYPQHFLKISIIIFCSMNLVLSACQKTPAKGDVKSTASKSKPILKKLSFLIPGSGEFRMRIPRYWRLIASNKTKNLKLKFSLYTDSPQSLIITIDNNKRVFEITKKTFSMIALTAPKALHRISTYGVNGYYKSIHPQKKSNLLHKKIILLIGEFVVTAYLSYKKSHLFTDILNAAKNMKQIR